MRSPIEPRRGSCTSGLHARRAAFAEVFAEDATYTDPLVSVRGRDGLDATIAAVQGQFGGLVFSLAGAVDAHHDIARFTWYLGPKGAEPVAIGFDVAVVGDDGLISQVLGFLDKVPAGARPLPGCDATTGPPARMRPRRSCRRPARDR